MKSLRNRSVLIIGCGWVGKKLGSFLASKDYKVYGTTRSQANFPDLESHHVKPIQLELPFQDISNIQLPETDAVIISISPGRGENREEYPQSIRQISKVMADSNKLVVLYSSTSAYGNAKNNVTEIEAQPDLSSSNILLAAEGELRELIPDATILRLSGLYGEDRHPVKYLAGRTGIKNGDAPVNLVHREDVIRATELMIEKDLRGEIFNVCAPDHPKKEDIYTTVAERFGMKKPEFLSGGADRKLVSSEKITNLRFRFVHENPISFNSELLEN